ncbi:MAG: hypothetical protein ABIC19_02375 [Patescibacteria group bacterium]|nr:hypothetical protein [Patescibacteria group bacterium]
MKNFKIITKRLKIKKKSGRVTRKSTKQSHYRSDDSGKERRDKRRMHGLSKKLAKKIINLSS